MHTANEVQTPIYLENDFEMFCENMSSYIDPKDPDKLTNYLNGLLIQLKQDKSTFIFMVDQLAMAIMQAVNIESNKLSVMVNLEDLPELEEIRPYVQVHNNHREIIDELMSEYPEELVKATLLIHLYKNI